MKQARLLAAAALLAASLPTAAGAQEASGRGISVVPILDANANGMQRGWGGVVVTIPNDGEKPLRGRIEVGSVFGTKASFTTVAPYAVGTGASVRVRLPVRAADAVDVRVIDEETQKVIANRNFPTSDPANVLLVDVSNPGRLRAQLNDKPVAPQFASPRSLAAYGTPPQLSVSSPRFDPATGDPVLPDRAALWSPASAVVIRSDVLARVGGAELDALAGWVLAGGTLAVAITRPEDARNATLVSLIGGEASPSEVAPETMRDLVLPPGRSGIAGIPFARLPSAAIAKSVSGWRGGNLRPTPYGSSAAYGLGEVHLLAFDPTSPAGAEDAWAQARMIDLARAAHDRRSSVVFRQGEATEDSDDGAEIRRQLDPNESSRWAIAVCAMLLCIYAVIAGPVAFSVASRRGRPLAALRWLPVCSVVTFLIIVGIGTAAKGLRGRARHLTLVEAGAGMDRGTARRWRGFFASRAEELTVRSSDAGSVIGSHGERAAISDKLVVDRDGARLTDVAALPWQTLVVREDGFAALGKGISITPAPDPMTAKVTNRSGRPLRAVILKLPNLPARYFARLGDGESVLSTAGRSLDVTPDEVLWNGVISRSTTAGTLSVYGIGAGSMPEVIATDAPGLPAAWAALESTAGVGAADWLPDDVPVLLAQMDGGEGRTSDAGLGLESDRVLVRVVGFGGTP
ncbi:MAG: hypothetical protein WKG00_21505 [Polyangiaceae bacterium]